MHKGAAPGDFHVNVHAVQLPPPPLPSSRHARAPSTAQLAPTTGARERTDAFWQVDGKARTLASVTDTLALPVGWAVSCAFTSAMAASLSLFGRLGLAASTVEQAPRRNSVNPTNWRPSVSTCASERPVVSTSLAATSIRQARATTATSMRMAGIMMQTLCMVWLVGGVGGIGVWNNLAFNTARALNPARAASQAPGPLQPQYRLYRAK